MRERAIESRVVKHARSLGVYARKYVTPGHTGAPDRIFIKDGRVLFIEFKAQGQKPTESQLREHAALRAAGATVEVCDSVAYGIEVINAFVG